MVVKREKVNIENLINEAMEIEGKDISFIAKFDIASVILKELLAYDDKLMPCIIEIGEPSWDGYDREYIVSVFDGDIFCEKFVCDGSYLTPNDGVTFILPDCDDKCVSYLHNKEFEDRIFVDITDLVDENDVVECDDCNYHEYIIRDGNGIGVGYIITHEFV